MDQSNQKQGDDVLSGVSPDLEGLTPEQLERFRERLADLFLLILEEGNRPK